MNTRPLLFQATALRVTVLFFDFYPSCFPRFVVLQKFNSGQMTPSLRVLYVICLDPFSDISLNPQLADRSESC